MEFAGKTVIITGSGQGIGRVIAHAFAKEKAIVVIGDINEDGAFSVAKECRELGGNLLAEHLDIASKHSVRIFTKKVVESYGRIDVLINNASIYSTLRMGPFEQITEEAWDALMSVNLKGTWLLTKEMAPVMKSRNYGKIVNVGSSIFLEGCAGLLHYVTSKAGIIGMTRAMARELGAWNITVNTVMPGATNTEIPFGEVTPELAAAMIDSRSIKRVQTPEDLIGPIMFFASRDSDFVTGQSLAVNGGLSMQ